MIRGKCLSILLTLAIMLSSQTISWAAPTNSNLKLPVAIGVNHYKIFDKDGNSTEVSFVYKPDVIEIIVQPSGDSSSPSKVIKLPLNTPGGGGSGNSEDRDVNSQNPSRTEKSPGIPVYTDISKHWARNDIQLLAILGLLKGYPDGTFRPDKSITRAEFSAVLDRAIKLTTTINESSKKESFQDVSEKDWFYQYIVTLEGRGNINPDHYPKLLLIPNRPIPRQEMVVWLAKEIEAEATTKTFVDEKAIRFPRQVKKVAEVGLVKGFPDGTFRPMGSTTRAEAASIIVRFLKLKGAIKGG